MAGDRTSSYAAEGRKNILSVTTEPVTVKIASEPFVVLTARGYAPVVEVDVEGEEGRRIMFISAASLSQNLEELRLNNKNQFSGIRFRVKKESSDKFAKYIVEDAAAA